MFTQNGSYEICFQTNKALKIIFPKSFTVTKKISMSSNFTVSFLLRSSFMKKVTDKILTRKKHKQRTTVTATSRHQATISPLLTTPRHHQATGPHQAAGESLPREPLGRTRTPRWSETVVSVGTVTPVPTQMAPPTQTVSPALRLALSKCAREKSTFACGTSDVTRDASPKSGAVANRTTPASIK